ncbi:MAG: ROK family protein [Alphaproteobacteria bacterium]
MRIGIDLGGTKIEGIVLDDSGTEVARARVVAPRDDYAATLAAIADLIVQIDPAPETATPVGIGIPGTISPATGLIKNANSTWLIGRPFDRDLANHLDRRVRVANDANCFAISEATDGAAQGAETVFGVIVGTGVGGGLVNRGHIIAGGNAIAGEWGHTPLPWMTADEFPGRDCFCGRRGCIETFVSGPGFERDHAEQSGNNLAAADIVAASAAGDAAATASLARLEDRLARGLAMIINIIDPDVIVLGGGLSNIACLYAHLPDLIGGHIFSDSISTPIRQARHGDSSGVRGAAWLWPAIGVPA